MKIGSLIATAAAVGLLVSAPARAAAPVAAPERLSADVEGEGQFFGGGWLIPAIIVIALGLGLYFALEEDDEEPQSP